MKRRFALISIVALAVIAAACSTSTTSADGDITEAFTQITVNMSGGTIQIERTTGTPDWLAEASYSGEEPDFAPRVVDGVLVVDDGCDGSSGCTVRYRISVPEDTEVIANTDSADVTVISISAPVTVNTASGVVFLNTVKGAVSVATDSGDIIGTKLEAASATFNSDSGSIDVAFERIITTLVADTGSGNVTAQLAGDSYNLEIGAGTGAVDLKIDDDEASTNSVTLNTDTGDVTVYKQ